MVEWERKTGQARLRSTRIEWEGIFQFAEAYASSRLSAAQKENMELLRQLGIQIKAWEGQSDLREETEMKLAAAEKELKRLREQLRKIISDWRYLDEMDSEHTGTHWAMPADDLEKLLAALGEAQKGR